MSKLKDEILFGKKLKRMQSPSKKNLILIFTQSIIMSSTRDKISSQTFYLLKTNLIYIIYCLYISSSSVKLAFQ